MKKELIILSIALLSINVYANTFSWETIKTEIKGDNQKVNVKSEKNKQTKEYVKSQYGVDVNRKSAAQIQHEKSNKNIEIGMLYRSISDHEEIKQTSIVNSDSSVSVSRNKITTSKGNFGIFINGKLDLSGLGWNVENLYASTELYTDSVDIGLLKRFYLFNENPYTTNGMYVEGGGGISYQTKTTDKETGTIDFYGKAGLGYNYNSYNVNLMYKHYMESPTGQNGFLQVGAGYRF